MSLTQKPIPTPHHEGFTTSTETPLYWCSYRGASKGRALVLHGGPGAHHDYLLPQMLELTDVRELIFYDQRGGGKSRDESRDPITWETHVSDLRRVLTELGSGPITLIGYSWGALLAMLYLTSHGGTNSDGGVSSVSSGEETGVTEVVLISPAPASRAHRSTLEAEFARRQADPELAKRREGLMTSGLREADPQEYRARLFQLSVAGYFHKPTRAAELTPFRVIGRIQESVWSSLGQYDLITPLRSLEMRTLVVHGRDDPIPAQSSFEVAEALNARFLLLENCGHVPYVEQPRALFSVIRNFLNE